MNNAATKNLSKEKIQQLLAVLGSRTAEDTTKINATEYNWRQPHYCNSSQLNRLDNFTEKLATALAKKFSDFCRSDFNVTIASTTQHFASEFLEQAPDGNSQLTGNYYLVFNTDQGQSCGLIGMSGQTAINWAKQVLGDIESEENLDRDLSQLEESLLLDITSLLIEAISDCNDDYNFHPAKNIVKGPLPLELEGTEELCKITFNIKKTDSENSSEAYFLMPCSKLDPVVGKDTKAYNKFSAEDISKTILGHMQQIPVPITVQLASAAIAFEEIISLQVDDILLLDKKVDEPVELIVEGKRFLHGRPAKSAGRYAVVITELCNAK
jgi:flagellar motor switch protein FliM